ncbi:hypothetical protein AAFM79_16925 [Trichormus azollae HNT15244]
MVTIGIHLCADFTPEAPNQPTLHFTLNDCYNLLQFMRFCLVMAVKNFSFLAQ